MTSTPQLILAAQTLRAGTSLLDRIDAAAAAGFTGLGIRPRDLRQAYAAGAGDGEIAARLTAHGVRFVELEALRDWGLPGPAGERSVTAEQPLYAIADAFGADYLIAVGETDPDLDATAERFAALCARAREHGLAVAIEFVPFTSIPDAGTAWEIVRRSGAPNGGLLVDSWHHYRGRPDPELLAAIPADRLVAAQLDDADAEVRGDLVEDTLHHRRLPGEGSFDLTAFVRLLQSRGVSRWSVEVISDELHRRSATDVARAASAAARAVLTGALA